MIYDLKPAEFDPVKRAATLAEALGEVIPDLLGQMSIPTNPYTPDLLTLGSATTYSVTLEFEDLETGLPETVNMIYTSNGSETFTELLNALIAEGNLNFGNSVRWCSFTGYARDEDMYFTAVPKEGFRLTAAPVVSNITLSTDLVQGPTGKPSAYIAYQKINKPQYPLLVVTPMPVTSVNENWQSGSIQVDLGGGLQYYPFYNNYVRFACKITIESGSYDEVLQGKVPSAESIFQKLKLRLKDDNRNTTFVNKINATYNPHMTVTPTPLIGSTEWMSIASTTINLDIIEQYIETEGGIMTKVEFTNTVLKNKDAPTSEVVSNYFVERTDIPL